MAGTIRLFETDADGRLHEVDPADARRAERGCRRVNTVIDVLLTDEDLAQQRRDAEEAAAEAQRKAAEPPRLTTEQQLAEFMARLAAIEGRQPQ